MDIKILLITIWFTILVYNIVALIGAEIYMVKDGTSILNTSVQLFFLLVIGISFYNFLDKLLSYN